MKRIAIAILLLLIPLCCVAFAALSKTTSIIELDAWTNVTTAEMVAGVAGDISDSYETILYLEIAYSDADAQDGVGVSIEVSYGDDDWTLLSAPFITPTGAAQNTATLDGEASATDTIVDVSSATGLNTAAQKWFIEDAAESTSESVRTVSVATNAITIAQDLMRTHATGRPVWEIVHEYIFPIPASFAFVRVLINNTDANADIFFTTRLSKVTGL